MSLSDKPRPLKAKWTSCETFNLVINRFESGQGYKLAGRWSSGKDASVTWRRSLVQLQHGPYEDHGKHYRKVVGAATRTSKTRCADPRDKG